MKLSPANDGWDTIDPKNTILEGNQTNNGTKNQRVDQIQIYAMDGVQSEIKEVDNVGIQVVNDNSKKKFVPKKDFSIPQNTPNICFLRDVSGFIDSKTKNHIKKWQNYKDGSNDISNLYRDLEKDHYFIQWIFPNFFTSMVNPRSSRLTLEERNEIISSQEYTDIYLDNFRMFMRFLGIEAKINNDSNCQFRLIDIEQFKVCVFQNTHNLMRLQRVFASLSVLGQRQLALSLLKFLQIELGKLSDKNIYTREYEHFQLVKEEDNSSNIDFKDKQNYYFQKDLLNKWQVNHNILTKQYIDEFDFNKDIFKESKEYIQPKSHKQSDVYIEKQQLIVENNQTKNLDIRQSDEESSRYMDGSQKQLVNNVEKKKQKLDSKVYLTPRRIGV